MKQNMPKGGGGRESNNPKLIQKEYSKIILYIVRGKTHGTGIGGGSNLKVWSAGTRENQSWVFSEYPKSKVPTSSSLLKVIG